MDRGFSKARIYLIESLNLIMHISGPRRPGFIYQSDNDDKE